MRITIQVTCDDVDDAQRVIKKLAAPDNTWVDQLSNAGSKNPLFKGDIASCVNKIMGSSATGAEKSGSDDGATGAPHPNVSPGEPSIGKIGKDNVDMLVKAVMDGKQPAEKWAEHMKLLWKRSLVKFDGSEYWL